MKQAPVEVHEQIPPQQPQQPQQTQPHHHSKAKKSPHQVVADYSQFQMPAPAPLPEYGMPTGPLPETNDQIATPEKTRTNKGNGMAEIKNLATNLRKPTSAAQAKEAEDDLDNLYLD